MFVAAGMANAICDRFSCCNDHSVNGGGSVARENTQSARATALDPEILVFDEPSAGLDPIVAAGLDELILFLKRAFNMTILVVTHELASAFRIADRVAMLYQARAP